MLRDEPGGPPRVAARRRLAPLRRTQTRGEQIGKRQGWTQMNKDGNKLFNGVPRGRTCRLRSGNTNGE